MENNRKSFIRNNRVKKIASEPDAVIKKATSGSRAIGSRLLLYSVYFIVNCTSATSYNCDATITFLIAQQWTTSDAETICTQPPVQVTGLLWHGDLKKFIMTPQHTEAKIISPEKRETLTESHYMFCGTHVEEHWATLCKYIVYAAQG